MRTKHFLLIGLIILSLSACAFMPKEECPVTANAYVKNSTNKPMTFMIAKQEGSKFTFITEDKEVLLPGESAYAPMKVGNYVISVWERGYEIDTWTFHRFETSIRCKSKVWEYKGRDTLATYDYIGDFKPDMAFIPIIIN